MAVFIANEVKNKKNLHVNEEEIAFFAFHIGSYKEYYAKDEFEMIERLADECHQLGLCDASFKDDVLERETLSSTSFNNLECKL